MESDLVNLTIVKYGTNLTLISISLSSTIADLKNHANLALDSCLDIGNYIYENSTVLKNIPDIRKKRIFEIIPSKRAIGGGGVPLLFNSMEKPLMLNFAQTASEWNRLGKGMNLSGICVNSACQAFNLFVHCPKGFGKFNMSKEVHKTGCPKCNKNVKDCNNVFFFLCKYTVEGLIQGETMERKYSKTIDDQDEFETFENKDEDLKNWEYLEIEVSSLN